MTAALIVGEKLMTTTTKTASIASFGRPTAPGAIGSQRHSTHPRTNRPPMATLIVEMVSRVTPLTRWPSRSRLRLRPAMNAMMTVATPLTVRSCAAIEPVMTLPR